MPHDAIELDDGTLLIAETGAHHLVQMSAEGEIVRVVADNMAAPIGLAQKDADTVYFTAAAAGTVSMISLETGDHKIIASDLMQPEGITIDREGKILVIDAVARSLMRIDPDSGRKRILIDDLPLGLQGPPPRHPTWLHNDVVVGTDGTIYLNSDTVTAIYKIVPH